MDDKIINLTYKFMKENYDYVYLRAMTELAAKSGGNTTLIVGSSHALNGIDAYCFENAVNCSMHSQDIYYDSLCIKKVLENITENTYIKKCFLVFGYYIAFQDLSRGEYVGKQMLERVYYPLFGNLHNYEDIIEDEIWKKYNESNEDIRQMVEHNSVKILEARRNYYNEFRGRGTIYDFSGSRWCELSENERIEYGKLRAEAHNRQYKFKNSFLENVKLLEDIVGLLVKKEITPVIVIPPFSKEYNLFVHKGMKKEVKDMLEQIETIVIDFNEYDIGINTEDFADTDHLNGRGAYKLSMFLAEKFGK